MRSFRLPFLPALAAFALTVPVLAKADTVQGTAVVYAVGSQSGLAAAAGGTLPTAVSVAAGTSYLTFSASGSVVLNLGSGNNVNNADGVGAVPSISANGGYGSISGLSAPGGGYLTGVFVGSGGPSGAAPAFTTYTTTDFASASPALDQAFFIGDGLTGNGTGSVQDFYVPQGATTLYLGISDACGYNGSSSCYGDNGGSFNVDVTEVPVSGGGGTPAVTPEPSSLLLLGTGALGCVGAVRRRLA